MRTSRGRWAGLVLALLAVWVLGSGATLSHRVRLEGGGGRFVEDAGCDYSRVREFGELGLDYELTVKWTDWALLTGLNAEVWFPRTLRYRGECPPDDSCNFEQSWSIGPRIGVWHRWFELQAGPRFSFGALPEPPVWLLGRLRLFPEEYVYAALEYNYGAAFRTPGEFRAVLGTKALDRLWLEAGFAISTTGYRAMGFTFAASVGVTDWMRLRAMLFLHGSEVSDYGETIVGGGGGGVEFRF